MRLTHGAFKLLLVQTSVSGQVLNRNICKILSRVIFVASKPIFLPIQPRGPAPKGRYAKGCRSFLASSVNLEGEKMATSSINFLFLVPYYFIHTSKVISIPLNGQIKGLLSDYAPKSTVSWVADISLCQLTATERQMYNLQSVFNVLLYSMTMFRRTTCYMHRPVYV